MARYALPCSGILDCRRVFGLECFDMTLLEAIRALLRDADFRCFIATSALAYVLAVGVAAILRGY